MRLTLSNPQNEAAYLGETISNSSLAIRVA
jgi:hypothetical protein